jgi:hypothetical protein
MRGNRDCWDKRILSDLISLFRSENLFQNYRMILVYISTGAKGLTSRCAHVFREKSAGRRSANAGLRSFR